MVIIEKNQKCAYGPCLCLVLPGQRYCSRYCEQEFLSGHSGAPHCECGHAEEAQRAAARNQDQAQRQTATAS